MNFFPQLKDGILDSQGTLKLREDINGFRHWTCTCHEWTRLKWCDHVMGLYKPGLQVRNAAFSDSSPAVMITPRTGSFLIVPCLVRKDYDLGMGEVIAPWGNPRRINATTFEYKDSQSIGYVNLHHTLHELRTLVLEWLPAIPALYAERMTCSFTYHLGDRDFGHLASALLDRSDGIDLRRIYATAYNLLDEERCLDCLEMLVQTGDTG